MDLLIEKARLPKRGNLVFSFNNIKTFIQGVQNENQ
jgi:hypothetical protein